MSTQRLKKGFKLKFSTTIFKFITDRRMELALEMLKFTNMPIAEIANNVGYKHSQHFSKVFKNKYGVNPSFYRKNKTF